jgi:dienelactone hydrolase
MTAIRDRIGRGRVLVAALLAVAIATAGVLVLLARSTDDRAAVPDATGARSASTAPTTVPTTTTPPLITATAPPAGATVPGTTEWYTAPAPGGRLVTLGVYRPSGRPTGTVLVLGGADGFRRQYEDLAARLAASGHLIAVAGCWFDGSSGNRMPDAIDCTNGPDFKGMSAASVADVDALVAATRDVPGVAPDDLVLAGHSAGGGVALLRAGLEPTTEPVASSAGLLAPTLRSSPTDLYAIDYVGTIRVPVFVAHSIADPICPVEQAQAFVAALTAAGNPPKTLYLAAPANHAFPFQGEACADEPDVALSERYVREVVAWIDAMPRWDWSAGA